MVDALAVMDATNAGKAIVVGLSYSCLAAVAAAQRAHRGRSGDAAMLAPEKQQ